ncbi:MAG: FAD-binding oxidoreductase [Bacteroidetes bacterium]|nr:FAD-binding oxidoreductase [Bacteroidota bacterium]
MKTYEWAIVGSGIAGISIAEILTRQGHSVVLVEKNDKLASEATRDFHEWLHTGALYTLVPDKLITLRFILGAIDDLIEFYSCYDRMNLIPTESGLTINKAFLGWFDDNYIHFKYRVKGRKITLPWLIGVARSVHLIEKIHQHDWLRRRAGELAPFIEGRRKRVSALIKELLNSKEMFKTVQTPDFTINSRLLLNDMIAKAISDGLDISLDNKVHKIEKHQYYKLLLGSKEDIQAKNVALCTGEGIKYFSDVKTKRSYAPIAVVSGLTKDSKSFVELDYFPKNCINLLTKENGIGLAGGISLSDRSKCDEYLDYVVQKHQEIDPGLKELSRYVGIKTEITFQNQPRGYLYHIVNTDDGVWAVIPGKFTLAFSMAPEFYRRVYKQNPKKHFKTVSNNKSNDIISNTVWMDKYNKSKEDKNGSDKIT